MFSNPSKTWLALIIGNSRLHWGLFNQNKLIKAWDTNYLSTPSPPSTPSPLLIIASVVPSQTKLWQNHPNAKFITLNEIPLNNLYPTLGIDRALSLLGAGETWGFPILVIDAGTALTFTGADNNRNLIGGAILPGLGLQFSTLTNKTGQLPSVELPQQLPLRYAVNTQQAIQSGIIYTIIAGIKDFIAAWLKDFPESNVVITGGDRTVLFNYLKSQYPEIAAKIVVEKNLILWGIQKTIM
ncbi:pantothenate kinase, type III [Rivularia sp. PCC 7116]|uniref:pantothenate kinase n=1 Tax=Rivularia sp. PCC 7116 TaxID=373994 RepID=UPI00029EE09D|nr:pantothenate kinase [Rivularia sp. PCC 7116]AFY53400.1 pantothenate kinase, type III [Rivularia sp. PCC 7116]